MFEKGKKGVTNSLVSLTCCCHTHADFLSKALTHFPNLRLLLTPKPSGMHLDTLIFQLQASLLCQAHGFDSWCSKSLGGLWKKTKCILVHVLRVHYSFKHPIWGPRVWCFKTKQWLDKRTSWTLKKIGIDTRHIFSPGYKFKNSITDLSFESHLTPPVWALKSWPLLLLRRCSHCSPGLLRFPMATATKKFKHFHLSSTVTSPCLGDWV